MKFTATSLKALKPRRSAYYVFEEGAGRNLGRLGVKVYPSERLKFVFKYYRSGKAQFMFLGDFPGMKLTEARTIARELSNQVSQGISPKEVKAEENKKLQKKAQLGSVKQLFEYYADNMKQSGKRTYKTVLKDLEKEVYPIISQDTKAADVKPDDIVLVLRKMINRGALTQSNRVRSYLHAAFNAGMRHDFDPASTCAAINFNIKFNPVTAIPKQSSAERALQRYLKPKELKEFIERTESGFFTTNIQFLILIMIYSGGQRPWEIIHTSWDDIDFSTDSWIIPKHVSKNSKPHLVPLAPRLKQILLELSSINSYSKFILPSKSFNPESEDQSELHDKPMSSKTLPHAFKRYTSHFKVEHFTPRDIRRTCKTLMASNDMADKEVRDRLQNHAISDVSNRHYNIHDYRAQKLALLKSWEDWILSLKLE